MKLWPHQEYAHAETTSRIDAGDRCLCITAPTGGGKSVIMVRLLEWAASRGWQAVLYTNRKLLTEQMIGVLTKHGIPFGVRASGFGDYENLDAPIQIASLQTENARVFKSQKWVIHRAQLALFDEAHLQKSGMAKQQMDLHEGHDCAIVGVTATPVGISSIYKDGLIVAGTNSELRACGALVPCHVYAPSEMDTSKITRQKTGEYSVGDIRKHIWSQAIYGHVIQHWEKLNPDARPAILFAPGVPEAIGFVKEYERRGVKAASIDGDDVYVDGESVSSNRDAREDVLGRFNDGEIKVLCNRFVLREGVDIPKLYHEILATPIGSVLSCVQVYGRVLRKHPTTPEVIVQDHGGNWWRHGSPNADRDWQSVWGVSDYNISKRREERLQRKEEPEPIVCPKCGAVRGKGAECYKCGFRQEKKSRTVIQRDGTLKEMTGDIFQERVRKMKPDTERIWEQCYYRMKHCGRTFRQAEGLFFYENHYWPPHNLPYMPQDPLDWERRVRDVPREKLISKQEMATS